MNRFNRIAKNIVSISGIFYHGSNSDNIVRFKTDDNKFSLLGTGVYFFKKKQAAFTYGQYIYKVKMKGLNIAPVIFEFTKDEAIIFLNSLNINNVDFGKSPSGIMKPLWWALDGWDYYGKSRVQVAEYLKDFMLRLGYDGMLADYPNHGLTCVVWNYDRLEPLRV